MRGLDGACCVVGRAGEVCLEIIETEKAQMSSSRLTASSIQSLRSWLSLFPLRRTRLAGQKIQFRSEGTLRALHSANEAKKATRLQSMDNTVAEAHGSADANLHYCSACSARIVLLENCLNRWRRLCWVDNRKGSSESLASCCLVDQDLVRSRTEHSPRP